MTTTSFSRIGSIFDVGLPRTDADIWWHPLCAPSVEYSGFHPGCLCLPGSTVQVFILFHCNTICFWETCLIAQNVVRETAYLLSML